MSKILVAGFPYGYFRSSMIQEVLEAKLENFDVKISILDRGTNFEEQLRNRIKDIDILVVSDVIVNSDLMDLAKNLKLICCTKSGPWNIDIKAANDRGIPAVYTPGHNADAVADLTFGLILAEARHIVRSNIAFKRGFKTQDYQKFLGPVLPGKTIGIVGFGNIGTRVAERAKGFRMNILVYDPYVSDEKIRSSGGKRTDLKRLLSESDFVTIHTRLSDETVHLIGDEELALMKKNAYLINTARGQFVDEKALYKALKNRSIAGAALDVIEDEINWKTLLVELENATITPHIAAASNDIPQVTFSMIAGDIERFLKGEKLKFVAKPGMFEFERELVEKGKMAPQ